MLGDSIIIITYGGAGTMDLFQLETFLTVAEERSFSRAAVRLHRTYLTQGKLGPTWEGP